MNEEQLAQLSKLLYELEDLAHESTMAVRFPKHPHNKGEAQELAHQQLLLHKHIIAFVRHNSKGE